MRCIYIYISVDKFLDSLSIISVSSDKLFIAFHPSGISLLSNYFPLAAHLSNL